MTGPNDKADERVCEECKKTFEKFDGAFDDGEFICWKCINDLPNKTGYCSLSCRRRDSCDDSC